MPQFDTFSSAVPVVSNPRDPLLEPILNIAKILEEYLLISAQVQEFRKPFITRVNPGAYDSTPLTWPSVDIRFVDKYNTRNRAIGSGGSMIWDCHYAIRYFHQAYDSPVEDTQVTTGLGIIATLFEYRNDLHGFCPRLRAEVGDVSQEPAIFAMFKDKGFIAGGEIILDVPVRFSSITYFDSGTTARDFKLAGGPRN